MGISNLVAREIVAAITDGEITAVQVAEALIEQERRWEHINSLVNFDAEQFLNAAHIADRELVEGRMVGPLHGLPLVVKDNIDVVKFPTTAATPALRDHLPTTQGPVIETLLGAGAIVMGKTNMHELAFTPGIAKPVDGSEIIWGAHGAAKNPYDLERSPAGSSSGTGAAVAAGVAPAGLGTDTGGSIRNPAAWCGITGLRPTIRRYSQSGVVPVSWTRDTIGPMARSVSDLALLDSVITGKEEIHPIGLNGLRLGIDREFFCKDCNSEILKIFETEVERLANAGAEIVEVRIPDLENYIGQIGQSIAMYECVRALPRYLEEANSYIAFEELISQISASGLRSRFNAVASTETVSKETYNHAMTKVRPALQATYANVLSKNCLNSYVFPSTIIPPSYLQEPGMHIFRGHEIPDFMMSSHNVQPASIVGSPGLTVAAGLTPAGLPAALGFDGPVGGDRELLSIGMAYEEIRPHIPPPVLVP